MEVCGVLRNYVKDVEEIRLFLFYFFRMDREMMGEGGVD